MIWEGSIHNKLVDNGADLVIGNHPHVLQPMETYNGVNIIYSMGNFLFGGNRRPENRTIIYQHTITLNNDKTVKEQSYEVIPCYVHTGADLNNYRPAVVTDETLKQKILDFMSWKISSPV